MSTLGTADTSPPVASRSSRGIPRPSRRGDISASPNEWQRRIISGGDVFISQKFRSDNCLVSPGALRMNCRLSVRSSKGRFTACHTARKKSSSWSGVTCMQDAPCWSARCFSEAPTQPAPSPTLSFSCPNDDPRPAFNHYLRCPFNNHSTPLHNFNSRCMRRFPLWLTVSYTQSFFFFGRGGYILLFFLLLL